MQQSFVRAWFALERFREESSFAPLHRIVVRRALDTNRRRDSASPFALRRFLAQIMAEPFVSLSLALLAVGGWYHALLAIQFTAAADQLVRAIDRLPLPAVSIVALLILGVSWQIFRAIRSPAIL